MSLRELAERAQQHDGCDKCADVVQLPRNWRDCPDLALQEWGTPATALRVCDLLDAAEAMLRQYEYEFGETPDDIATALRKAINAIEGDEG